MFSGMVFIFLPLLFGYLFYLKEDKYLRIINKLTSYLIIIILILMGFSLANLDNLVKNLKEIFIITATFFSIITLLNLTFLPILDHRYKLSTSETQKSASLFTMFIESGRLLCAVIGGLIFATLSQIDLFWVDQTSEIVLIILLFLIGIQLRNSGLTLRQILLNKHGLFIASFVITTSLIGGVIAALILDIPYQHGLAMASGFGWYSLAGILIGDALGPVYGGASFLIELLRELLALVLIPIFIHRYPMSSIGYGGATAMDFTLPIIQTSGGNRCVPIAIVSGFILSLLVPFLILFFLSI